ncbi:MAG: hypothetical protein JO057_24690 [Chloroflexi bacterium]|nr:hypothetical protein [Chloroflexota bacterium]
MLRVLGSAALALPVLSACAPTLPSSTSTPAAASTTALTSVVPTYRLTTFGPPPDFPSHGPQYQNGYISYPRQPAKALPSQSPGGGGTLTAFMAAYRQAPVPLEQNDAWQAINKQLNTTVQMNVVGFADYPTKLATLMAGNDLPDLIHLVNGRNAAPNLRIPLLGLRSAPGSSKCARSMTRRSARTTCRRTPTI